MKICQVADEVFYTVGQTDRWADGQTYKHDETNLKWNIFCVQKIFPCFTGLGLINPVNTKRRLLYLKTQFVPRSKHFSSLL